MINLKDDRYSSQIMTNDFSDEHNNFTMDRFQFLPSLRIKLKSPNLFLRWRLSEDPEIDIWKQSIAAQNDPDIDLEKLSRYIQIRML